MSQKLPVDGFKWVEKLSKFNEKFMKSYNENSDQGYFLKQMLKIRKNYLIFTKTYHFYQNEKKKKVKKFVCTVQEKENYVIHIRALKQALNHGLIF